MALRFVSLVLLSNLLLLTFDHGYGARKTTEHQWEQKHSTGDGLDDHQVTTHDNHMEGSNILGFIAINDLRVGKTISLVQTEEASSLPRLLPREEADSIPFSMKEFPNLLQLFSISKDSPQAEAIKRTLERCESKPIKGEAKFCATSLESMVDSLRAIFGSQTPFKVLTTSSFTKSNTLRQKYTFLQVKEVSNSTTVVCHHMPYPYAVFYCHSLKGGTKVFEISLGGEHGDHQRVTAFFMCHMDTSAWVSDVAVLVLGLKHGSPVCHYVFPQNLIWVPY
ncbi:BURP domain protein USPL1-like [Corylus avellana]|uniref:BURP domain protein USPL1-like n=1 Tax=Corylus avellana TaxID=13451 RepID=UPI001E20468F|nr:BURP domain protein USPL1-like [Corylus avellana]